MKTLRRGVLHGDGACHDRTRQGDVTAVFICSRKMRPEICGLNLGRRSAQRISATFVQPANFFAVVALISDLHPRAEGPESGKFLNGEADGLGGCGEATITGRRASPDILTLVHIQFGVLKSNSNRITFRFPRQLDQMARQHSRCDIGNRHLRQPLHDL